MTFEDFAIGNNPPFCIENYRKTAKIFNKLPIESECSSLKILKIFLNSKEVNFNDYFTIGFILNRNIKIPINVFFNKRITTFSCFDEINLFFYRKKTSEFFLVRFTPCRKFNNQTFFGEKIVSVNCKERDVEDVFTIECHIENLRSGYHYNFLDAFKNFNNKTEIIYNNNKVLFFEKHCPLCFSAFENLENLVTHINTLHVQYQSIIKNSTILINEKSILFSPPSTFAIDFKMSNETSSSDEQENNYFDLVSSTLSSENSCKKFKIDMKPNISSKTNEENEINTNFIFTKEECLYKINCMALSSKKALVNKIYELKNKKVDYEKCLNFLYLENTIKVKEESNTPKPASRKNFDSFKNYITALKNFKESNFNEIKIQNSNDFIFYKNRNTRLYEYKLKNYGLLIEKEFDVLDYSEVLAQHLNIRLDQKSTVLSKNEYKFMKNWNVIKMKYLCLKEAFKVFLAEYDISNELINFIYILTNRGILCSDEVVEIILNYLNEK